MYEPKRQGEIAKRQIKYKRMCVYGLVYRNAIRSENIHWVNRFYPIYQTFLENK